MSEEECRLFPHEAEEFVQIIGCRGSIACADAVGGIGRGEKAKLLVVDEFPLLSLFETLDGEAQLFLKLVVGVVEEVRDTCVHTHYCLESVEGIFAWCILIVDIRLGDDVVFLMSAEQFDMLLAMVIDAGLESELLVHSLVEGLAEVRHLVNELDELFEFEAEEDSGSDGSD